MSTGKAFQHFDFRRPSGLPAIIEQRLLDWQRGLGSVAPENWAQYVRSPLTLEHRGQDSMTMIEARQRMPLTAVGYRFVFEDEGLVTMFVCARPLVLALIHDVLGESGSALPADRELTAVESSLSDLLFDDLAQAVTEAWPEYPPAVCRNAGVEAKPQRTRLFRLGDKMVLSRFTLTGPFGSQDLFWFLPQQRIEEFIAARCSPDEPRSNQARQELEGRAREIPAELVVRLGEASLDVSDLAKLRVGDVIILNQRITDPLVACVAGEPKFTGWPGRVGSRQAFQVGSLT
jgi:flagellar motor switch protein FliM